MSWEKKTKNEEKKHTQRIAIENLSLIELIGNSQIELVQKKRNLQALNFGNYYNAAI